MREIVSPLDGVRGPLHTPRLINPRLLFAANEPGVWLDPSDISTLFQDRAGTIPVTAAEQPVGMILDKSGNDNHAVAYSDAARAVYRLGPLGNPYLDLDGVDDTYVTPTITPGTDKVQVFAGVRKLSDVTAGTIVELSESVATNNGAFALVAPHTAGATSFRFVSKATITATATNSSAASPITAVLSGIGDIAAPLSRLRTSGVSQVSATTDQGAGNYLPYPIYVGRRAGTGSAFVGHLYGLIVRFGPNLDPVRIRQVEDFINKNTGAY